MDLIGAASLASIVGRIVGIVRFGFTWAAWTRAKAAEEAAREAREAVRNGTAPEGLQALRDKANEFFECVQQDQIDAACLRARDLAAGISHAKERWQSYFTSPKSANALEEAGSKVEEVSRTLTTRRTNLTSREKDKVWRFCNQALS